jgi:hypothetical protein
MPKEKEESVAIITEGIILKSITLSFIRDAHLHFALALEPIVYLYIATNFSGIQHFLMQWFSSSINN